MIYDYVVTKPPLNEDTLTHYGVKGMKWRKRKKGFYQNPAKMSKSLKDKIQAQHLADDISDKRKRLEDITNAPSNSLVVLGVNKGISDKRLNKYAAMTYSGKSKYSKITGKLSDVEEGLRSNDARKKASKKKK